MNKINLYNQIQNYCYTKEFHVVDGQLKMYEYKYTFTNAFNDYGDGFKWTRTILNEYNLTTTN